MSTPPGVFNLNRVWRSERHGGGSHSPLEESIEKLVAAFVPAKARDERSGSYTEVTK
jgi:hypothetical protein